MAQIKIHCRAKLKWWVKPLMYVTAALVFIGLSIDDDKFGEFIARHGIKVAFGAD